MGWSSDKDGTIKLEEALISPDSLALLAGTTAIQGATSFWAKDNLTLISDGDYLTGALTETPETTAATNVFVYTTVDGVNLGSALTFAGASGVSGLSAGLYYYSGTYIAASGVSEILVDYYFQSSATTKTITISSNKFSPYVSLEGKTLFRGEDGVDYAAQVYIPKMKFKDNYSVSMESTGDPKTWTFDADIFKDSDSTDMVIIKIEE